MVRATLVLYQHTIMKRSAFFFSLLLLNGGCGTKAQQAQTPESGSASAAQVMAAQMRITSTAFKNEEAIPKQFSCEGDNISPALSWVGAPKSAKSFALVLEDPDAPRGMFVHWVIYDIPPSETGLAEHFPLSDTLVNGTLQGKNGAGSTGYIGPCPPSGKPHRYYFRLYAVNEVLHISGDVTREKLMSALEGHVVGEGELMGTYVRK